ncbi:MAG: BBP7 family outer membrane beta-barrel protein [Burkholderiales bacterium]
MSRLPLPIVALLLVGAATAHAQTPATDIARVSPITLGAEALFWWFNDSPAPVPLVTNAVLTVPNLQTYLGGQSIDTGMHPGFRLSAAYATGDRLGFEGSVLYLPTRTTSRSVSSSGKIGSVDLILPYLDAQTGIENGTELSFAPTFAGSATEALSSNLLGAEVNATWALPRADALQVDVIGGLRYLRLRETYTFTTSSPYIPPFPVDIWDTTDRFAATNSFYGAQLGVRARFDQGPWFGAGSAKVALGGMVQEVDVSGSVATNDYTNYTSVQTFTGGYFALPTNIGNYSRTQFAVVPELSLKVGYRVTPSASLFVGYSLLYASNVVRPGNQLNRTVNTTQSTSYTEDPTPRLVGPAQPAFAFNDSSFWAQGVNMGVAIRF